MENKNLNEMSVLELKGVLFDLQNKYNQETQKVIEIINTKLKEEQETEEVAEDGVDKE